MELNEKQCELVARALKEFSKTHREERDLTITEYDELKELIKCVDAANNGGKE